MEIITSTVAEHWMLIGTSAVSITALIATKQGRKAAGVGCVMVGTILTSIGVKLGAEAPKAGQ